MVTNEITGRDVFQQVTFSGTSAQSSAFAATTKKVSLVSSQDCYIKFGTNPTATAGAGSFFLPAKVVVKFGVEPGEKVAAIQSSAGGILSIAEGSQLP